MLRLAFLKFGTGKNGFINNHFITQHNTCNFILLVATFKKSCFIKKFKTLHPEYTSQLFIIW